MDIELKKKMAFERGMCLEHKISDEKKRSQIVLFNLNKDTDYYFKKDLHLSISNIIRDSRKSEGLLDKIFDYTIILMKVHGYIYDEKIQKEELPLFIRTVLEDQGIPIN